jgi:hypothetical protein
MRIKSPLLRALAMPFVLTYLVGMIAVSSIAMLVEDAWIAMSPDKKP